jgi:hypothetical protein
LEEKGIFGRPGCEMIFRENSEGRAIFCCLSDVFFCFCKVGFRVQGLLVSCQWSGKICGELLSTTLQYICIKAILKVGGYVVAMTGNENCLIC